MKFSLFKQLYSEALEDETTLEYFIAERGWQEWMECYTPDEVAELLSHIYRLANSPLKDTREVSRAEFSRQYAIPVRTLEDWDTEKRSAPAYVKLMLDYAQFMNL